MELSKKDYYEIQSLMNGEGGFVEYEKKGEILSFEYKIDIEQYVEDNYYNGTGGSVLTEVNINISNAGCYNEDGEEVNCNFNEHLLIKMHKNELIFS